MNGNISGEVLTGTINGTVKISGDLIPRGIDGYSPTIDVEPIDGGTKVIINDISGTKTATIKDGATGKTAYQYAVDSGYTGTEVEFAEKLAEEIPKALKVIVEFDGSTSEHGTDFPVACDVSYSQILAAHESGAVIICAFYDSYTYDEIVAPIVPYPIGSWFYTCGTGTQYRYFIRFTPDGAYANCEPYGSSGDDGFSPIANVKATAEGAEITITDKSGTTKATVYNGKDGAKGDSIKGEPGADGISPTVSVSKSGKVTTVSITDKNGTKTAKINDGADGAAGSNGKDGTSATHSWNGTTLTIASASGTSSADLKGAAGKDGYTPVKGKDYFDGTNGKDGVSVTHSWNGTTLNITSASGTSSANLKGETGAAGSNGKDGTSVTVKSVSESSADGGSNVVTFSDGKTLTVKNGKAGTGTAGKDGKSAYQYAVDGGFTGTESEFAKKLAAESAGNVYVNITADENGEVVADHTYADLLAAHENGATIICIVSIEYYGQLIAPMIYDYVFYTNGTGADGKIHSVSIGEDGAWYFAEDPTVFPDFLAEPGEPGYIQNKPEGVGYVRAELGDTVVQNTIVTKTDGNLNISTWLRYDSLKGAEKVQVVFDGVVYNCPVNYVHSTYDGDYWYIGDYSDQAHEYPFWFNSSKVLNVTVLNCEAGEHTISIYLIASEEIKKIDPKFLPDGIGGVELIAEISISSQNTTAVNSARYEYNDDVKAEIASLFAKVRNLNKPLFSVMQMLDLSVSISCTYMSGSSVLGVNENISCSWVLNAANSMVSHFMFLDDALEASSNSGVEMLFAAGYPIIYKFYA